MEPPEFDQNGRKPSKISEYFGRKVAEVKTGPSMVQNHQSHTPNQSDRFQVTGNFPGSELIFLDDVGEDGSLRRTYYKSMDQLNIARRSRPSQATQNLSQQAQFEHSSHQVRKSPSVSARHADDHPSRGDQLISANDPRIENALLDETSLLSNLEIVRHKHSGERSVGAVETRSRSKHAKRSSVVKENSYPSPKVNQQLDFNKVSPSNASCKKQSLAKKTSQEKPDYLSADSREIREALRRETLESPGPLEDSVETRTVHGYTELKERMIDQFGEELVLSSSPSHQKQKRRIFPTGRGKNDFRSLKSPQSNQNTQPVVSSFDISKGRLVSSRGTQTETASGYVPLFATSLCFGCLNSNTLHPLQLSFGTNGNLDNTNIKDSARLERVKFGYDTLTYQPSHKLVQELQNLQRGSNLRNQYSTTANPGIDLAHGNEFTPFSSDSKGGIKVYDPFVQKRKLIRQKITESGTSQKNYTYSGSKGDIKPKSPAISTQRQLGPEADSKPKQSPLKINQKSYLSNFESKLSFYENSDIKYFSLERRRSREKSHDESAQRPRLSTEKTSRTQLSSSKSTGQIVSKNPPPSKAELLSGTRPEEKERGKFNRISEVDAKLHGAQPVVNISPDQPLSEYYLKKQFGGVSRKLSTEFSGGLKQNPASDENPNPNRYLRQREPRQKESSSQKRIKIKSDKERTVVLNQPQEANHRKSLHDSTIQNRSKHSGSRLDISQSLLNNSKTSKSRAKPQTGLSMSSVDKVNANGGTKSTAMTSKLKELSTLGRQPEPAHQPVSISPFDPVASSTRIVGPPSKKSYQGGSQSIQIPISLNINLTSGSGAAGSVQNPMVHNILSPVTAGIPPSVQHNQQVQHSGVWVSSKSHQPFKQHASVDGPLPDHEDSWALFEQELSLTLRQTDDQWRTNALHQPDPRRKDLFQSAGDQR